MHFFKTMKRRNYLIEKRGREKKTFMNCKLLGDLRAAAPAALCGAGDQRNASQIPRVCSEVPNDVVNSTTFGAKK